MDDPIRRRRDDEQPEPQHVERRPDRIYGGWRYSWDSAKQEWVRMTRVSWRPE